MPMHLCVPRAFCGAGAAKCDAVRELCLKQLPVPRLVSAGENAARRGANGCAVEIQPDAGKQMWNITLRQTRIGAGRASFDTSKAGIDAAAHGVGVSRPFRMRAEHCADCDSGHGTFLQ
jgi:hypothetical protein